MFALIHPQFPLVAFALPANRGLFFSHPSLLLCGPQEPAVNPQQLRLHQTLEAVGSHLLGVPLEEGLALQVSHHLKRQQNLLRGGAQPSAAHRQLHRTALPLLSGGAAQQERAGLSHLLL